MTFLTVLSQNYGMIVGAQCVLFATLEAHLFHINDYFKSRNLCEVFPYHFSLRVASLSEWVWSLKGPSQMGMREAEFSVKGQAVSGEGNGKPLQCSYLENPMNSTGMGLGGLQELAMDREAGCAAGPGVAKSRT